VGYELDASGWPIAHFKFIGRLDDAEIERYFHDSDSLVAGSREYACVMDGTSMLVPEAEFVKRQALWIREHSDGMRRLNHGIAFVMPSALIRGLVRAVMYFQAIPVPYDMFNESGSALAWARERAADIARR
jgi:hypothetical protein